jgi:hypothetical protein
LFADSVKECLDLEELFRAARPSTKEDHVTPGWAVNATNVSPQVHGFFAY